MKKYILYLLFCPVIALSQPGVDNNGYNKFYYDNGKLSSEGTLRNGKPDGYWKTYFSTGGLKSEGNRKEFLLDSIWKFYNEKGVLVNEIMYSKNKKNGFKKTYSPDDGKLVSAEHYSNDVKHGPSKYYYKEGKIRQMIPFDAGKEDGISFEFSMDSVVISLIEYRAGFIKKQERINRRDAAGKKQGIWKEFHDNGIISVEGKYIDDKKNGFFKEYNRKGDMIIARKYVNDVEQKNVPELAKVDMYNEYYPDGKVKYIGAYREGVPEGVHREFTPEGKVSNSKVYADGLLVAEGIMDKEGKEQGPWKELHPNGQVKAEGEYKDGKKTGEWKYFYPNGKPEQTGTYNKNGRPQGTWKWFYDNGNLLREETFSNGLEEGTLVEYSDSGKIITKGEYAEGLQEGPWFFELGDYREEGSYKNGRRDGTWKHYYIPSFTLRFEGNYRDGNPDGKHTYYYPTGKVMETGKYSVGRKEGDWRYYTEDGMHYLTIYFENDIEIKYDGVKIKPTQQDIEKGVLEKTDKN